MTKAKFPQEVRAAYHEAGHAVASFWLFRRFKYISIVPDQLEGSLGHIVYCRLRDFDPRAETAKTLFTFVQIIQISMAGPLAEKELTGRMNAVGASTDWRNLQTAALISEKSARQANLFIDWLRVKTEALIRLRWKSLEALAKELLKQKKIEYRDASRIIDVGVDGQPFP